MEKRTFWIDPLKDPRWKYLVDSHPETHIFHTHKWLEVLKKTYGFEPVILTSSAPDRELTDGLPLCRIQSWITGNRLVALPFSEHCQPLTNGNEESMRVLFRTLKKEIDFRKWEYAELRPLKRQDNDFIFHRQESFYLHWLDLRPDLESIWRGFHKNCIQRRIRHAEHSPLKYQEGNSESLLASFYRLHKFTRHRHLLPPQPYSWFKNLRNSMGNDLCIHLVSFQDTDVAGIVILRHKKRVLVHSIASDMRFHHLGVVPVLLWRSISEEKLRGMESYDLGRTHMQNTGLMKFKNRLGAEQTIITYLRYPTTMGPTKRNMFRQVAAFFLDKIPGSLLLKMGTGFYRHIA